MRIALIIIIILHALIHLFGFLKAFRFAEFEQLTQPISKTQGLLWLVAFMLFALAAAFATFQSDSWWVPSILALVVSQILIFMFWKDAKFGTVANLFILLATILAFAGFQFDKMVENERSAILESLSIQSDHKIANQDLAHLPNPVQKWLSRSGMLGKRVISKVSLTQDLQLKLKPEQEAWYSGVATQVFTVDPPAFLWSTDIEMNAMLNVVGRDKFENGKGEMLIKLNALIPIVNAKDDPKIDEASLQRYLAEIVWFPSAALSKYITWERVDERSALATLEFEGTKGSGVFYFTEEGDFETFTAQRYKDTERLEWTVTANQIEEHHGIRVPVDCEASWKLESGQWTWLRLKVEAIDYD